VKNSGMSIRGNTKPDGTFMEFFSGEFNTEESTQEDFSTIDLSDEEEGEPGDMTKHMSSDPMVQALVAWYKDEGEPAIRRVAELEKILATEREEREKEKKDFLLELEQAKGKQEMLMRHCETLEKDLEAQTEEAEQFKNEVKELQKVTSEYKRSVPKGQIEQELYGSSDHHRRDRYLRVIQEKDEALKKVQAEFLELTEQHNKLQEELEALMSEKIDAETASRRVKNEYSLLERQMEKLKEHSQNQLASSREREQKLRDQIKELSEYYQEQMNKQEQQLSSGMKHQSLAGAIIENDVTIIENDPVIKIPKDTPQNTYKNLEKHSLKQQIKRSKRIQQRSKSTDSHLRRSSSIESNMSSMSTASNVSHLSTVSQRTPVTYNDEEKGEINRAKNVIQQAMSKKMDLSQVYTFLGSKGVRKDLIDHAYNEVLESMAPKARIKYHKDVREKKQKREQTKVEENKKMKKNVKRMEQELAKLRGMVTTMVETNATNVQKLAHLHGAKKVKKRRRFRRTVSQPMNRSTREIY